MSNGRDVIERLADYAPTSASIDAQWSPAERAQLRARVLTKPSTRPGRLRFVPRSTRRVAIPLLSAAAIVALMAAIALVVVGHGDRGGRVPAAADPSLTSTPEVGVGQFAYRVVETYEVDADGHATLRERDARWAAPDGSLWDERAGYDIPKCSDYRTDADTAFATGYSVAFFAGLPSSVDELNAYLRDHVSGSSSRDEAVFTAVGDALRDTDLLASSQVRANLVGVLGETDHMTVHSGVRDYLNRPAVRVDFVDQRTRPGALNSLFFDPATFQLLEERYGSSGAPTTYAGPSPAYDAPPAADWTPTPEQLTGAARVTVMTTERAVDQLPSTLHYCPLGPG